MSGTGTGSRLGKKKCAEMKSGQLTTEAQAAKALGVSRERLSRAIRIGLINNFWSRGRRWVFLP